MKSFFIRLKQEDCANNHLFYIIGLAFLCYFMFFYKMGDCASKNISQIFFNANCSSSLIAPFVAVFGVFFTYFLVSSVLKSKIPAYLSSIILMTSFYYAGFSRLSSHITLETILAPVILYTGFLALFNIKKQEKFKPLLIFLSAFAFICLIPFYIFISAHNKNILYAFVGFLPWTIFFISSLIKGIRYSIATVKSTKRIKPLFSSDTNDRILILTSALQLLFFPVADITVPLSILTGYFFWGYIKENKNKKYIEISALITLLIFVSTGIYGVYTAHKGNFYPILPLSTSFILISITGFICLIKKQALWLFASFCAFSFILFVF